MKEIGGFFVRQVVHLALITLGVQIFYTQQSFAQRAAGAQIVPTDSPHIFGWAFHSGASTRSQRGLAQASRERAWVYEDQPLRVQRRIPRYRHLRNPMEIHLQVQRELDARL